MFSKKIIWILLGISISLNPLYADEGMAPYLLDGSIVLYFPNIKNATDAWSTLLKQTSGLEYENTLSRIQMSVKQRLSANIFNSEEANNIGIDYNGALAYVNVRPGVSYAIFTIDNKNLLESRLASLATPIIHRIEGKYIIFSSSLEILDYQEFRGLESLDEFRKIAKVTNFRWDNNFFWIDSTYFKNLISYSDTYTIQGDRIAGTFITLQGQIIIDAVTSYDSPEVRYLLQSSMDVSPVQQFSILDYESGTPAIIGQTYVNINQFLAMLQEIDRVDYLEYKKLFEDLLRQGVNIHEQILSHLKGKVSYVIREFSRPQDVFKFTISSEIVNKKVLNNNLKEIVRHSASLGMAVLNKNLFTQQFYGWKWGDMILWVGIVEDHLIVSSDEENLILLVQNIYQSQKGFLRRYPLPFQRLIKSETIGGQMILQNPFYIQNISAFGSIFSEDLMMVVRMLEWDFYLIDQEDFSGRRDIINIYFYE